MVHRFVRRSRSLSWFRWSVAAAVILCSFQFRGWAYREPALAPLPDFDRRADGAPALPARPEQTRALDQMRARLPQAQVRLHGRLATPRWVTAADGYLSGPEGRGRGISPANAAALAKDPHRAAKGFLKEHQLLFGYGPEALDQARLRQNYLAPHSGLRTTVWEQELDGIPVYEARLVAHTTRREELVSLSSLFLPKPEQAANAEDRWRARQGQLVVSAREAAAWAARNLGEPVEIDEIWPAPEPTARFGPCQRFLARSFNGQVTARLVWLPSNLDQLRLCWQVEAASRSRGETYRCLVDAQSGEVRLRRRLTLYAAPASYRVFTSDSPSPLSPAYSTPQQGQPPCVERTLLTWTALDTNASPNGWIDDDVHETRGNNVDAHLDRDANDLPDLPRPRALDRVFDFPLNLNQPPASYGDASVVQLFYWCNWMHDRLYDLGFTEAAGNFQNDNFGRGGLGGDAVQADAQDGSGYNNANFTPAPDGEPPRIQMFLFDGPTPARDGSIDGEIVLHEYAHGLSDRLVGGGVGLSEIQSLGLGEGWSDFYALSLLSEPGDDPDATYAMGGYVTFEFAGLRDNYYFGIRRYPYSTDLSKNPLTFKDIDPDQALAHPGIPHSPVMPDRPGEVHDSGEVWCVTLWEARAQLIHKHGFATGNALMLRLVTDGMRLSPPNPTFVEARDAILEADRVDHDGANLNELWRGFARRGLGFSAMAPLSGTTRGVFEAFDLPDDLRVYPQQVFKASGPVGGPFDLSTATLVLSNQGPGSLTWTAAVQAGWLGLSQSAGVLPPGGACALTLSLHPVVNTLPAGSHTNQVWITNLTSGFGQGRSFLLRASEMDWLTEWFAGGDFDLAYQTLTFTPDGSTSFYSVCRQPADVFPVDPEGSEPLDFSQFTRALVVLPPGKTVSLFGRPADRFYAHIGGCVWFDENIDPVRTVADHFAHPQAAALAAYYPLVLGGMFAKTMDDCVALTYLDLLDAVSFGPNNFQIELFFDGRIRMTFLDMSARSGVTGLSRGQGLPASFIESDFSSRGDCRPALRLALPRTASEGDGCLAQAGRIGLPFAVASDLTVNLACSDSSQMRVPASVVIPAGATEVGFDLSIVDNALLDGTHRPFVVASAPGFASATASTAIADNETAILSLSLPAAVREGDGGVPAAVRLDRPTDSPVAVTLTSSDPSEVQVPPFVVVPAGRTSAAFCLTVVDDADIDGDQRVTLTAQVPQWTPGAGTLLVRDNEPTNIWVDLPEILAEGQPLRHAAGTIRLAGNLVSNVTFSLQSSDRSKLAVSSRVVVSAGQSSNSFDLTPINDAQPDGPQTVMVTARASGFAAGSNTLVIWDNASAITPSHPWPPSLAREISARPVLAWSANDGQLLTNGGFESGDFRGWNLSSSMSARCLIDKGAVILPGFDSPRLPAEGACSALIQVGGDGWAEFSQEITLPARASSATLTWSDCVLDLAADPSLVYRVEIRTAAGTWLENALAVCPQPSDSREWTCRQFSLDRYLAQTIRVAFLALSSQPGFGVYVDNVRVRYGSPGPTTYDVYFGASSDLGPGDLVGSTTNTTWALPLLDPLRTYFWQIVSRRVDLVRGPVWEFTTRGADHLVWGGLSSTQRVGVPFPATLTARDEFDRVVPGFAGPATLRGLSAPDSNATTILITEVHPGAFAWVEFLNASAVPVWLDGWEIIFYDQLSWPYPALTFRIPPGTRSMPGEIFSLQDQGDPPGQYPSFVSGIESFWNDSPSANPIAVMVRQASGEMVDFFCAMDADPSAITQPMKVPASQWIGQPVSTNAPSYMTYQRQGDQDHQDSSDWVVGWPSPAQVNTGLRIPFQRCAQSVPLFPEDTVLFTNGLWAGQITARAAAPDLQLQADDGQGHWGGSGRFSAVLFDNIGIVLAGDPSQVELGQSISYTITVANGGPETVAGLRVTNLFPVGAVYLEAETSQGAFEPQADRVVFDLGALAGGASARLGLVMRATATGLLTNLAVLAAPATDTYPDDNQASAVTEVLPEIRVSDATVREGNVGSTGAVFAVTLSSASDREVAVHYATADGTSRAGIDYRACEGMLVFPAGVTIKQLPVTVFGDVETEEDESFRLELSAPVNAALGMSQATATILDDDGKPRRIHSLTWEPIGSPQGVSQPMTVSLTARDAFGDVANTFEGSVAVAERDTDAAARVVGAERTMADYPMSTVYRAERTQAIYPAAELGGPGVLCSLALCVLIPPDRPLSNYTIRIKHSASSQYREPLAWDDSGWTVVCRTNLASLGSGWVDFNLDPPFTYNGADNLMVDFSYVSETTGRWGSCALSDHHCPRVLVHGTSTPAADPLTWSGASPPPMSRTLVPNVSFGFQRLHLLQPAFCGPFTNGIWSGLLRLPAPANRAVLVADDLDGHGGTSEPFEIRLVDDVSMFLSVAPGRPAVSDEITYRLQVTNTGPSAATGVIVSNRLPANSTFTRASSSQGTFAGAGEVALFDLGTLPPGAVASLEVHAIPHGCGWATNSATVMRAEADAYLANNTAAVILDVLPTVTVDDVVVAEGNGRDAQAVFTLRLSGPYYRLVEVRCGTRDGTAKAGLDYLSRSSLLSFQPGATSATFTVPILANLAVEPDKTFLVDLQPESDVVLSRNQALGTIRNDDGLPGDFSCLAWSAIPSPEQVNVPFHVTLTALDAFGKPAVNLSGPLQLTAQDGPLTTNFIGTNGVAEYALFTDNVLKMRAQAVYLAGELGGARRISALALRLASVPARRVDLWTIRMKHTTKGYEDHGSWETNDWTLVYRTNQAFAAANWVVFPFQAPFAYNGLDNLMVDFSYKCQHLGPATATPCAATPRTGSATLFYCGDEAGYPESWAGATPAPSRFLSAPDLELISGTVLPVEPETVGPFFDGVWNGFLRVGRPGRCVTLVVDDLDGHTAQSSPFVVRAPVGPLHHFGWSALASTQFVQAPFLVTIDAQDAFEQTVTDFAGSVSLASVAGLPEIEPGSIAVQPSRVGPFVQGSWSGWLTIPEPSTHLALQADDGSGHVGRSSPFRCVAGLRLRWSGAGALTLSWSEELPGLVLESSPSLAPAIWTPVATTPTQVGQSNSVVVQFSSTNRFYRLRQSAP